MDGDLYQSLGGSAGCRGLAEAFYGRVARDPVLRPLFPGKTLTCAIEEFTAFLIQFLGGPPEDTQRRWWLSLRESHARFQIGEREREAWLRNMRQTLDEAPVEGPARSALRDFFEHSSRYVVGVGPGSAPSAENREDSSPIQQELARHWSRQQRLDQAVAAVRHGAPDRAVAQAEEMRDRPSVFVGLLGLMLSDPALAGYVREKLLADPSLARERFNGRTLLHMAAAAGNAAVVELLLGLGALPDTRDGGGHTPLYSVANECSAASGVDVVRVLVRAGATVDACDGVKHCSPLHMAARRGNVPVAEALLDAGAAIEMRDSLGETPLRRAVNCGKTEVAALLFARGADPQSKGSKGLTPRSAARTAAMRQIFHT